MEEGQGTGACVEGCCQAQGEAWESCEMRWGSCERRWKIIKLRLFKPAPGGGFSLSKSAFAPGNCFCVVKDGFFTPVFNYLNLVQRL